MLVVQKICNEFSGIYSASAHGINQFLSPLLNVYVDLQTTRKHEEETAPRM
jgi:hypothetical protein